MRNVFNDIIESTRTKQLPTANNIKNAAKSLKIRCKKTKMRLNQKHTVWLLIGAIIIAAFFLRSYDIDNIPAGLYPDEAVNGTDALLANSTGEYKLFYTSNYGREGLFINLQALTVKIFGNTLFGLKLWSILFGTLTVLGVFLLTKELFQSARAGLIGAYFTAFSYWAINFSRIGFRANMVPFILVFTFYFLFKGIRTRKYLDFIISGLIFGLGVHTYIAFRVSPLVMVAVLVALILTHKNFLKQYWRHILVFAFAMMVTATPMLLDFFYFHPEHYASRTGGISVLNPEVNKGNLIGLLAKTFGLSLAKYNFWGDQNWRHNYPPYPILNPLVGLMFLAGLCYSIFKFLRLLWLRVFHGIREEKFVVYTLLLSWFFVLLIPEFLAYEGNPHALRAIGTIPVVFVFATIPVLWLLGKMAHYSHAFKIGAASVLLAGFIFVGIADPMKYFVFFANNPQQYGAFDASFTNMAKYLIALPEGTKKYVIANAGGKEMEDGLPVTAHPIKYLTAGKVQNLSFLVKDGETSSEKSKPAKISGPAVFVLMKYDQAAIDWVRKSYPQAQVEKIDYKPGHDSDFTVIYAK